MNQHISGAGQQVESIAPEAATQCDALSGVAEEALKAMVEYQVESLRFIGRRIYCNLEFMRHLRHCAGWHDIAQVQQAWFKECVADYGEELGRLVGTGFQLARNDFTPLQSLIYRPARGGRGRNGASG